MRWASRRSQAPEMLSLGDHGRDQKPGTAVGSAHPRQGRVIDAISEVLAEEGSPMKARDVHAGVEEILASRFAGRRPMRRSPATSRHRLPDSSGWRANATASPLPSNNREPEAPLPQRRLTGGHALRAQGCTCQRQRCRRGGSADRVERDDLDGACASWDRRCRPRGLDDARSGRGLEGEQVARAARC